MQAANQAGIAEFGENYVQEALGKVSFCGTSEHICWHFIGHLQSNKAGSLVGKFDLIQSVDRDKVAVKIDAAAQEAGIVQDILLQVHLAGDRVVQRVEFGQMTCLPLFEVGRPAVPGLRVLGLMGMAPLSEPGGQQADPRPYFDALKGHFDQMPPESQKILSMGMSGDLCRCGCSRFDHGANRIRVVWSASPIVGGKSRVRAVKPRRHLQYATR